MLPTLIAIQLKAIHHNAPDQTSKFGMVKGSKQQTPQNKGKRAPGKNQLFVYEYAKKASIIKKTMGGKLSINTICNRIFQK